MLALFSSSVGTKMSTILDTTFRFKRNLRGNVTLFFALSLPFVLLAIGISIDFGRAAMARTQLNSAADAAALAALTPAMLQQSASVANTAAIDMFNGQISAINWARSPAKPGYRHDPQSREQPRRASGDGDIRRDRPKISSPPSSLPRLFRSAERQWRKRRSRRISTFTCCWTIRPPCRSRRRARA